MRTETYYTDRFMLYFLSSIESIGAETMRRLEGMVSPLRELLYIEEKELILRLGLKPAQAKAVCHSREHVKEKHDEFIHLSESGINFITVHDENYPRRLRNIRNNPMVLYYIGSLPDDSRPSIAIVGARASTCYGESVAESFARSLAGEGIDIISGLASGIDGGAHKGALDAPNGRTFGVLAGGVNVIYPKENSYLYKSMAFDGRGGVISEIYPGVAPISRNFPMRNRIISGLSDLVLVVEARSKSGSLITVDYAMSQGRTVMAVPGRITDPMSRGCNMLISNGSRMANSSEDILEELGKIKND